MSGLTNVRCRIFAFPPSVTGKFQADLFTIVCRHKVNNLAISAHGCAEGHRAQYRAARISQEELSFRSKRTRAYFSGLERGQRNPTAVTLDEIATALGVSIVELLQPA